MNCDHGQIYERQQDSDLSMKMIMQVHDELIFEIAEKDLEEALD